MPRPRFPFSRLLALPFLLVAARAEAAETSALSNLSVRTSMTAGQTLIVGGVLSGGTKNILVRAGGPVLNQFGLQGMVDPRLALYTGGPNPIATNDNWPAALEPVFSSVGAFAFDANSRDAALSQSLAGAFTVQAGGTGAGTVLVEAYDVTGGTAARMVNLSARNRVGTGSDILIAGFSISGTGTKTVLIRAIGPGLAAFGVPGTLADPLLQLFDGKGARLAGNDTWDPALAGTFTNVGAFSLPAGSKDAAMIATLAAGNTYTVQVAGADNGTGEALIEVYEIPAVDPIAEARLPNRSTRAQVQAGFPRSPLALKTTGELRVRTIFVDFSDAPATRTPQSVFALVSPGAENFWRGISYGRLNTTVQADFRWLRMSKPSTDYGWSTVTPLTSAAYRAYLQEAINLAVAAGIDFSTFDTVCVLTNPDAAAIYNGPAFSGSLTAGGRTFNNAIASGHDLLTWNYKWFNHEGGHMMGLPDLYASGGQIHRFVGEFSIMGNIGGFAPEYLAWERWLLGWIDDDQIVVPKSGTTTVALTPIEIAGGLKMAVVPTGATTAVVVESRQRLGFDSALTKSGPLVYFVDTSIDTLLGPIRVLPIDDTDVRKTNAPLSLGQTLTYSGVVVKYVSADDATTTIEVTRP